MAYYHNNTIIYLNGAYVKAAEATTDFFGQSLHYGYAVFEGIQIVSDRQWRNKDL